MVKNIINILFILVCIVVFGFRTSKSIEFKQNVTGYLKRAADANTINLAYEEITKAINYLEKKDITSGYTSILYQTPDEDIDFWFRNLKASQVELQNLRESKNTLENTNVLIKLRETLLDNGERTKVTVPKGLPFYPHNTFWAIIMLVAVVIGLTGLFNIILYYDKKSKAS